MISILDPEEVGISSDEIHNKEDDRIREYSTVSTDSQSSSDSLLYSRDDQNQRNRRKTRYTDEEYDEANMVWDSFQRI